MSLTDRVDGWQRQHPCLGFPVAVVYKYFDDQGTYLAALMTYYGFLSLFPLLLLFASVLGFVLQGNPDLQREILSSTLSQFPIIGDELREPKGLQGSGVALVVGGVTALYGTLGVAQAMQNAMNVAWAVPRYRRPNPIKARLRSFLLISTAGAAASDDHRPVRDRRQRELVRRRDVEADGGAGRGRRHRGQRRDLRRRLPRLHRAKLATRRRAARRSRRRRGLAGAPVLRYCVLRPRVQGLRREPTACSPSCSA